MLVHIQKCLFFIFILCLNVWSLWDSITSSMGIHSMEWLFPLFNTILYKEIFYEHQSQVEVASNSYNTYKRRGFQSRNCTSWKAKFTRRARCKDSIRISKKKLQFFIVCIYDNENKRHNTLKKHCIHHKHNLQKKDANFIID